VDTSRILETVTDVGPQVGLLAHFAAGLGASFAAPQFAVRPYCHTDHCGQVYFDAMGAVASAFGEAGCPAPATIVATRAA
jgi:hypothetical protein